MHLMLRTALILIALAIADTPAHAQPQTVATQVQLGAREAGKTYPLALNAQNADCKEPLDFRFTSNTAWLKLPADPVVRGVTTGQSRALLATIDLTNMSPGRYQAMVDVECENCGWFIFQSCKIDKQQINFLLDVAPAAAPQPQPQGAQKQAPRAVDPNDPRIPGPQRAKLKAAIGALDIANAKKKPCEEERDRLAAAARAAREAANAAARAAKEAADKAARAEEEEKKALAKFEAAAEEARQAKAHADKSEAAQGPGAKDTQEAKAAAAAAADAAVNANADHEKAKKAAKDAQAAAQNAANAAPKAKADAKAAADAAAEAANKCARAQADADQAQAEKDAAEAAAAAAIPQPPPAARKLTPEEELERLRQEMEECWRQCANMARSQRIAVETLRDAGLLRDQEAIDNWMDDYNEVIDGIGEVLGELGFPGADYGALDYGGVLAKGSIVAIAAGQQTIAQKEIQIKLEGTPAEVKKWLQDTKRVAGPEEANRVYQDIQSAKQGHLEQMGEALKKKEAECAAAEKKYEEAKEKLEASKKGGK